MFARVSIIEGQPEHLEAGIKHYRENVLPMAKKTTGFKGAYLLVDRKSGKNLGITLWDSRQDMENSANSANQLRAQAARDTGASKSPIVELYEVVVQP
jgi:heme-degrading monooxygenase HmoA